MMWPLDAHKDLEFLLVSNENMTETRYIVKFFKTNLYLDLFRWNNPLFDWPIIIN